MREMVRERPACLEAHQGPVHLEKKDPGRRREPSPMWSMFRRVRLLLNVSQHSKAVQESTFEKPRKVDFEKPRKRTELYKLHHKIQTEHYGTDWFRELFISLAQQPQSAVFLSLAQSQIICQ